MSDAGIPLVDLRPFRQAGRHDEVVDALGRACEDVGFLAVTGHGVPPELVERTYAVSSEFFDLPLDEKLALRHREPLVEGRPIYRPLESERLAATLGQHAPGDLKECLDFGPGLPGVAWPSTPAELKPTWLEYHAAMVGLSEVLVRIFALALGLDEDFFVDKFTERSSSIRVINYPALEAEPAPGQVRAAPHRDYGCLTILRIDSAAGGLQVQTRAGDWIDVQPVSDSFVINIGDLMARWTNDHWVSTLHRVVNPPAEQRRQSRRQSLVFFHNPRPEAVIEPIKRFGRAAYEPVTAGDYIRAKATEALGEAVRV